MIIQSSYVGIIFWVFSILCLFAFAITGISWLLQTGRWGGDEVGMLAMIILFLLTGRRLFKDLLESAIKLVIDLEHRTITATFILKQVTFNLSDATGYFETRYDRRLPGVKIHFSQGKELHVTECLIESVDFLKWALEQNNIPLIGRKRYTILRIFSR